MLEAMNEFGVDTLKAVRALEAAGFEPGKAEAMVTVFGGPAAGNVATKMQVREVEDELKTEIRNVRTELKAEIQDVRTELKAEIQDVRTELKAEIQDVRTELQQFRTEVRAEFADVRLSIEKLRAQTYRLMLAQTVIIVGLIVSLDRLL